MLLKGVRRLVKYTSSSRGAKVTLIAWLAVVLIISVLAPSAKDYEANSTEGSIHQDTPSKIAKDVLDEEFPTDDGLTALVVFHRDNEEITEKDRENITKFSEWLDSDNKPEHVTSALPFHQFPEEVQDQMFSEDHTTLLFNLALAEGLESDESYDTLEQLRDEMEAIGLNGMQLEITGPAGISSDTIELFRSADVVLILSTVALIFVILILIYRSPILAITPLIIAAIVYGVVDRVLGLVGKYEIFAIEGQAVSIMLVLMFAVLTDYSLFVFSRYREELRKSESKYGAMSEAIHHVSEPIFFSGGTVFLAMLTLFVTVFEPYNHFAPVFSIAVVFILIAGLTLIPAIFALMGRRAFWPFVPKVNEAHQVKKGFWHKVSKQVKKRPGLLAGLLMIVLLIGAWNVTSMNFSFNLLKSFPEDISSRQGFELLEENYPAGQLAPLTVILKSNEEIALNDEFLDEVNTLQESIRKQKGIESVSPDISSDMLEDESNLPNNFISDDHTSIQLQVVLDGNPYEQDAIDTVKELREGAPSLLKDSSLSTNEFELHYAGQTAEQLDVREMNQRDMILLFVIVTVLLTVVLGFQTRSVLLPSLMMGTILLSYVASLGFGWLIFKHLFGYDAISYRLPVYTFVFMVALGIDYNIMLVSRIKEIASNGVPWRDAVGKGVELTGGVISSAGLILAATFSVLMTQPLQELFLFGFIMAMGILFDTFIIRGFFLPSLLIITHRKEKGHENNTAQAADQS